MNGFFIVFYVVLFLLGGNMGIPMGMPPGPEDPIMARIAPDECLFYASWSGVADIDAQSNPTEEWMAQPMTSKAIAKLRKAVRGFALARGEKFDPETKLANRMLAEVLGAAAVQPAAVYLDKLDAKNGAIGFRGGIMVSLGDRRDLVQTRFNELYDAVVKQQADPAANASPYKATEINGEKTVQLAGSPPLTATIRDKYFVLGIGIGALDSMAKNSKTPPPKWLADMRDRLKVVRIGSVGLVRVEAGKDLIKSPLLGMGQIGTEDDLFSGVQSVGWVSGLDDRGFISRTEIIADKTDKGLLSIINLKPIPKRFLKDVPADSTAGIATRVSTERILEMVKDTARRAKQEESLNEALQKFQKVTGVSLEEELLDAVGDYVHAYYKLEVPNFEQGWVVSVRIDDEMSFPAIFDQLNRGIKNWIKDMEGYDFQVEKNGLHEIYSVTTDRKYNNFAWCVVDDQWYLAPSSREIIAHLKAQPINKALMTDWAVEEAYAHGDEKGFGGPVMIVNLNMPDLFEAIRPFAGAFRQNDQQIYPDFDFKWNDIPSVDEFVKDVRPNFMFVFKTERGFELLQRQTYPGSSPPVSVAAVAVASLPVKFADLFSWKTLRLLGW